MQQCADEAAALRHTGVEIPLAWWRFARARDLDDPARRSSAARRSRCTAERLHRRRRAGVPQRRSAGTRPAPRSPTRCVDAGARGQPRPARDGRPCASSSPVTRPRRTPCSASRRHPAPCEYSVLAGHCLRVLVLAETGTAGGDPAGARADHGVRRAGGHLRHRRPPRLRRPLPGRRVRRPRSDTTRALEHARAGRRTQRAAGVPAVAAPRRGAGGAAREG